MAKSIPAKLIAKVLDMNIPDRSYEQRMLELESRKAGREKKASAPPQRMLKSTLTRRETAEMPVFFLNEGEERARTVFYYHGGSYVDEFLPVHWVLMDRIAQGAEAELLAPDYGLAPFHTAAEAYERLLRLYAAYREEHPGREIILMGDSAGGGLALGLTREMIRRGMRIPERLVLLSPWVDGTMRNPAIAQYAPEDPMLHAEELKASAAVWAGEIPVEDPRVSPLFGSFEGFPESFIVGGTGEIFYPDFCLLRERMEEAGVKVKMYIAEGMNHVFPAMPIPESRPAVKAVTDFCIHGSG